jgi:hypothetical protein
MFTIKSRIMLILVLIDEKRRLILHQNPRLHPGTGPCPHIRVVVLLVVVIPHPHIRLIYQLKKFLPGSYASKQPLQNQGSFILFEYRIKPPPPGIAKTSLNKQ